MKRPLTIGFCGDVMLGRGVNEAIAARGSAYPWGDLRPLLAEVDLFLVNLECAVTSNTRRWHDGRRKVFYFRADPSAVRTLEAGGVDFACLANNHANDFGTDGLIETLRVLDASGIAHAGAGSDLAEARAPAHLKARGVCVGVVAFADHPKEWAARSDAPGIHFTPVSIEPEDFSKVRKALAATREVADLVVFTIHWGPNMWAEPTAAFRVFARQVMAAGADVFWGHSAHVVQGIEFFEGRPILYDTGDFVDDYSVDDALRNDLSALFLLRIGPSGDKRLELVPVKIADMQVNRARGADRNWFVDRMAQLSTKMGTDIFTVGDRLVARPSSDVPRADPGRTMSPSGTAP